MEPVGMNILVQLEKRQSITRKGILLASNVESVKRRTGKVLAVGPGTRFVQSGEAMTMPLSPGDRVVFGVSADYRGMRFSYDGEDCMLITADDVLGTISDTDDTFDLSGMQPLDDKVLVQVDESDSVTLGGIVLADSSKPKSRCGTVLRIGSGKLLENGAREPVGVDVGDHVMWNEYAGNEIQMASNNEKVLIIRARDLVAAW